jgi:hypothetical protein
MRSFAVFTSFIVALFFVLTLVVSFSPDGVVCPSDVVEAI